MFRLVVGGELNRGTTSLCFVWSDKGMCVFVCLLWQLTRYFFKYLYLVCCCGLRFGPDENPRRVSPLTPELPNLALGGVMINEYIYIYIYIYEAIRLSGFVVRKELRTILGKSKIAIFLHETIREHRSRHENPTTRIQSAFRVFFLHMT